MTLSIEDQKKIADMYLLTGNMSEVRRRTGFSRGAVEKYCKGLITEVKDRPLPLNPTDTDKIRMSALDEIDRAIEILYEKVINNPTNQIILIKAIDVYQKLIKIKAGITGEDVTRIEKKSLNIHQHFKNLMEGNIE
ncbi:MAG: hypothetical protein PVF58_14165 [Candidatus Methanofastidiosia archaeon]|jgi:hypothetical protein